MWGEVGSDTDGVIAIWVAVVEEEMSEEEWYLINVRVCV